MRGAHRWPNSDESNIHYCATFSREMQLENSFQVNAPPDQVFAYLLDINKVVGCVPGAELSEVVDPTTFKGKVKIKVGPITVAYNGTARLSDRNDAERVATLSADGRETTGPGSARATAQMRVLAAGAGSQVQITTEYHVAGRVANFGRGVMEDVSKRLISEMANCIQANLQGGSTQDTKNDVAAAEVRPSAPQAPPQINAFALLLHLIRVRFQRLLGRKSA
jgi:carbon monoxide dehydrogenase subunit G